jgi:hypothetical protein
MKNFLRNKTSDFIQTNHFASYSIQIQSTIYNSIDFIIIKADNNTIIRLYDFSKLNTHTHSFQKDKYLFDL